MIKNISFLLFLLCFSLCLVSCSSNDNNDTEINDISTVIGNDKKWCIYKANYKYSNGEEITIDIDKFENNPTIYREYTFKEDNTCTVAGWEEVINQSNKWCTGDFSYIVKDDMITIYYDNDIKEYYAYDKRTKNLIVTGSFKTTTSPVLTGIFTVYIRKM